MICSDWQREDLSARRPDSQGHRRSRYRHQAFAITSSTRGHLLLWVSRDRQQGRNGHLPIHHSVTNTPWAATSGDASSASPVAEPRSSITSTFVDLLHFRRKGHGIEGLLDETVAAPVEKLLGLSFDAATTGEEPLDARHDLLQRLVGLTSAHLRHGHVEKHERDLGSEPPDQLDGLLATRCGQDLVAELLQQAGADLHDLRLVVYDQNGPGTMLKDRHGGLVLRDLALGRRKKKREGRAFSHLALNPDKTRVVLDDAVDRSESQPRSLSRVFGREEGFEDPPHGLGVHSGSRVGDDEFRVEAWWNADEGSIRVRELRVLGVQEKVATLGHGLPGVDKQVQHYLFEL